MITKYDFHHLKEFIDELKLNMNFSYGKDGDNILPKPEIFILVEEIYQVIQKRLEISSIKYIETLDDELAYEWHSDDLNPNEMDITDSFLLYLPGCETSVLEIKGSNSITPNPYELYHMDTKLIHRAGKGFHGKVMKFTFL